MVSKITPKTTKNGAPGWFKKILEPKLQEKVPTSIITTIYHTLAMLAMLKYLRNWCWWTPKIIKNRCLVHNSEKHLKTYHFFTKSVQNGIPARIPKSSNMVRFFCSFPGSPLFEVPGSRACEEVPTRYHMGGVWYPKCSPNCQNVTSKLIIKIYDNYDKQKTWNNQPRRRCNH